MFRAWDKTNKKWIDDIAIDKNCVPIGKYKDKDIDINFSTKIKDKYGKEIYEGDIIYVDGLYYEVFWDNIYACWAAETDQKFIANELNIDGVFQMNSDESEFYEIVGNKYENPEIMHQSYDKTTNSSRKN